MKATVALARLDQYQSEALSIMDEAAAITAGDPLTAREPLSRLRWLLVRKLREYQVFKHSEIFEPAIGSGSPRHVARAERLRERCNEIEKAFEKHIRHWMTRDVAREWEVYKPAMLAMVKRLRTHLEEEKAQVAALLEGAERTRHLTDPPRP